MFTRRSPIKLGAKLEYLRDNLGAGKSPMPDAATRAKMAALVAAG